MDLRKLLHYLLLSRRRSQFYLLLSHRTNLLLQRKNPLQWHPLKPPNPTNLSNASTQPSNLSSPSSPLLSLSLASHSRPKIPHNNPRKRLLLPARTPSNPKSAQQPNQTTPKYSPPPLSAPSAKNPAVQTSVQRKVSTWSLPQAAQCPTPAS